MMTGLNLKSHPQIASVNDGYFDTIQEAYAAHPGKRVGLISGGIGHDK